ncbi:Long-chain-fatty-acid--CoA ligase [hydrothermal vent metagenome]|uniref:Long-chain-fatty-acid--CoA ligase n=1 Tax=hydrothermal vent metagenome TaxID=652676 RepID=A0A3B0UBC1_9ZZZZ
MSNKQDANKQDVMTQGAKMPPQVEINGVFSNADLNNGPYYVDGCDTLGKLFAKRCKELGQKTAHREKVLGIWRSHSWNNYYNRARRIGLGLISLGLKRAEVVSILSEDNKEWAYMDLGIQSVGAIASGIYTTDAPSQLAHLLKDSQSRFLFVENDEMLDKYLEIADQVPLLKKVIILDRDGLHGFKNEKTLFLDQLYDLGDKLLLAEPERFEKEIALSRPEDIGLLIYTSGTTGLPKGAMISNRNIIFIMSSSLRVLPYFRDDEQLCFLPLCHVLERNTSIYSPISSKTVVNFVESTETIFDNLQEVSPHVFTAVPRVWEKIYSKVTLTIQDGTALGKFAYEQAINAGMNRAGYTIQNRKVPFFIEMTYRIWDFLVLKNLRRMLGFARTRRAITGAAPISPDLIKWYWAIGVRLVEGYGQTEGSGVTSVNTVDNNKNGTVGPAIPGVTIKISDSGEILFTGANVFPGYWKAPQKTAQTMTKDGYLKTGDLGTLDSDGFLSITGRLKDIIITAGGKNITPSEIENKLKSYAHISDVVVIGDKRKYLTCLVMIDQENVEKYAQDKRIPFSSFASLCAAKEVQQLISSIIEEVNKDFARVEQIKDFRLIDIILTAEDDELTATMKLKRSFVEKRYQPLIEEMYN